MATQRRDKKIVKFFNRFLDNTEKRSFLFFALQVLFSNERMKTNSLKKKKFFSCRTNFNDRHFFWSSPKKFFKRWNNFFVKNVLNFLMHFKHFLLLFDTFRLFLSFLLAIVHLFLSISFTFLFSSCLPRLSFSLSASSFLSYVFSFWLPLFSLSSSLSFSLADFLLFESKLPRCK